MHYVKSVRIRSFSCPYLQSKSQFVFSSNPGIYGPEKLRIQTLFRPFQGVEKWNIGLKPVKKHLLHFIFVFYLSSQLIKIKSCMVVTTKPNIAMGRLSMHSSFSYTAQKWNFWARICSVNVSKSTVSNRFSSIYWENPHWKT